MELRTTRLARLGISWSIALVVGACGKDRAREPAETCATWHEDLAAVFASRCGACHGASAPSAGYELTSYLGALGPGSDDTPNALAGEPMSVLLRTLDPATANEQHESFADIYPLAVSWVVDCELGLRRSRIHAGGIMNINDPDFHGRLLAGQGWRFDVCAGCHGQDFGGGTSGASCTSCHERGPTDCTTCHGQGQGQGQGPTSGAHAGHTARYECAECHVMPQAYTDPGHILGTDGLVDAPPAEVVLGALAGRGEHTEPPAYDPDTGTCSGVYCHGATFADTHAMNTEPTWNQDEPAACNTCHGMAPSSHADASPGNERCAACHPAVVHATGAIRDPALHIDGAVALGKGTGDCADCHGHAPPPDLLGNTDTQVITVGAHQSHVQATHGLRGPIPCSDCHVMPVELDSPGHIDSPAPAEVFVGGADFAGLAAARGATPAWDRPSATCSDAYCHGGGTGPLASDDAAGLVRAPVWTWVDRDQAACGTCHGVPPVDASHAPAMTLESCHTCHASTVDMFGNIIVRGPAGAETSEHIDGTLDF